MIIRITGEAKRQRQLLKDTETRNALKAKVKAIKRERRDAERAPAEALRLEVEARRQAMLPRPITPEMQRTAKRTQGPGQLQRKRKGS